MELQGTHHYFTASELFNDATKLGTGNVVFHIYVFLKLA